MTIPVGGEIGEVRIHGNTACLTVSRLIAEVLAQEIHTVDQHLTFHFGNADAIVNGKTVSPCVSIVVARTRLAG